MTVCILKPCKVRHDGTVHALFDGDFLTIDSGREARLIESGHARAAVTQDYRDMAEGFRTRDPCKDCWSWNQQHRPDLWREHIQALQNSDISKARLTFNQMTAAWSAAAQPE